MSADNEALDELLGQMENQDNEQNVPAGKNVPAFSGTATQTEKKKDTIGGYVEPKSQLHVTKPLLSSTIVDERLRGAPFEPLRRVIEKKSKESRISSSTSAFSLIAVVTRKSKPMQSSTGSSYSYWLLNDLHGTSARLLLFGDAHRYLWKAHGFEQSVVGVSTPSIKPGRSNDEQCVLSIISSSSVWKIGDSHEVAFCQGTRKDGQRCNAAIRRNDGTGEYCKFHIASALKNMRRSMPQASGSNLALSMQQQQRDQKNNQHSGMGKGTASIFISGKSANANSTWRSYDNLPQMKMQVAPSVDKIEEKAKTIESDSGKRQLQQIASMKRKQQEALTEIDGNKQMQASKGARVSLTTDECDDEEVELVMSAYQQIPPNDPNATRYEPEQLTLFPNSKAGHAKKQTQPITSTRIADKEATTVAQPYHQAASTASKMTYKGRWAFSEKFGEHLSESLKDRSLGTGRGTALEDVGLERYLNTMEKYEAADERAKATHVIHVKVHKCSDCKSSWSESKRKACEQQGHQVKQMQMSKRFFRCSKCKAYQTALNKLFPADSCAHCGEASWDRVGMKSDTHNDDTGLVLSDPNGTAEAFQQFRQNTVK